MLTLTALRQAEGVGLPGQRWADGLVCAAGVLAMLLFAWPAIAPDSMVASDAPTEETAASPSSAQDGAGAVRLGREIQVGGYSGVSYTLPSEVLIQDAGKTDLKVNEVNWMGRPFKAPIYYGIRALAWGPSAQLGAMIDFTHAKAMARLDEEAAFSGTRNGQPVAPKAKVGDVFRHLEFSHGHNLVTLNGLARMGTFLGRLRPYVGLGGGVALPHTEVGYKGERGRTYEYQYAGLAWQALAGIEVRLGRVSLFFEYKFTFAPYAVPLSQTYNGWLLVTDLWRQLQAWIAGDPPPGGTLRTTLATHHAISGVLVRVSGSR